MNNLEKIEVKVIDLGDIISPVSKAIEPLIQNIEEVGQELEKALESNKDIEITENNKTEMKKQRATLSKKDKELTEQLKIAVSKLNEPAESLRNAYKEHIGTKFKQADETYKTGIATIENAQKLEKENEIKMFFEELKKTNQIEWLVFEDLDISITLSKTKNKLIEEVESKTNAIIDDLATIASMENSDEILLEYKKSLALSNAIKIVQDRAKELEKTKQDAEKLAQQKEIEKAKADEIAKIKAEQEAKKPVAPVKKQAEKIETLKVYFEVKGTKEELTKIKEYILAQNVELIKSNIIKGGV